MLKTKSKNLSGFTLIEMMISLFLSVMVAFFVYTMMISSYNAYNRLSSLSKNANSIRFFISSINNSVRSAWRFDASTNALTFYRYDQQHKREVMEKYVFGSGTFTNDNSRSSTLAGINGASYNTGAINLVTKEVWIGGKIYERVVVSNIIRAIYYSQTSTPGTKYKRLNLGVIYDDVVNAKQNETTGQITSATEMRDEATINRRLFCFDFINRCI